VEIFRLADRLHKTPEEIRRDFSVEEFEAFMLFTRIKDEL